MSAILSFLGGSVFRMLWGEISSVINKMQEHKQEIERMKLQGVLDAEQHKRQMESIKVQADLGVKTIQVQSDAVVSQIEAQGWLEAIKATGIQTGVKWVDAWNACIRPGVATWAVFMLTAEAFALLAVSDNTVQVCFAFLGMYAADRTLMKRGK